MANTRFAYVRLYEQADSLLPNTFFVIRIDGKGFHKFSTSHNFDKPNDERALRLMNDAATRVVNGKELMGDCILAFGESDEYSFVFKRRCNLHGRRASKLVSLVTSLFSSTYVFLWPIYFPNSQLELDNLPVFDGRIVQYPTETEVRDYLRWRQADTHINNLYNTCFWTLVQRGGLSTNEATKRLEGTISSQKQELLFSQFGINYNELPDMYKRGSLVVWQQQPQQDDNGASEQSQQMEANNNQLKGPDSAPIISQTLLQHSQAGPSKLKLRKPQRQVVVVHEDLLADAWWQPGGRGHTLLAD
ncbi:tRNA-His guanylyltransferase [Microbotryomycetes sp. JL221]|nr:tRNA-His guanylyltransferase [Microbotryomycetes sp. JL221]